LLVTNSKVGVQDLKEIEREMRQNCLTVNELRHIPVLGLVKPKVRLVIELGQTLERRGGARMGSNRRLSRQVEAVSARFIPRGLGRILERRNRQEGNRAQQVRIANPKAKEQLSSSLGGFQERVWLGLLALKGRGQKGGKRGEREGTPHWGKLPRDKTNFNKPESRSGGKLQPIEPPDKSREAR